MSVVSINQDRTALTTVTFGELLALNLPPKGDLLTPWMRERESALLYAPTGVGKSMLALTVALAVAGGGEFLGWKAPKPRRVLFVDGEMAMEDIRDRAQHLVQTVEGLDTPQTCKNLSILARQYQGHDAVFPDLAHEEGRNEILRMIRAMRVELVILDNLSTLATIADENAASEFNDVTKFLLSLKQSGVACLLVHHSGKSGTTYRGSSKLATTFEVIAGLRKLEGSQATHGTAFELVWDKFRGKAEESVRGRLVSLETDDQGIRWNAKESERDQIWKILNAVRSGLYKTQREISKAIGIEESAISTLKGVAISQGLISREEWKEQLAGARGTEWEGDDY